MTDFQVQETRKLASFRTVDAIEPIEGADAIELAVVGGWKVVTKKGEFKIGDLCVYFEIDSFLPDGVPAFQFLVDKSSRMFGSVKGHKLRTIKLRGQISQGLILPLSAFPIVFLVLREALSIAQNDEIAAHPLRDEIESLRFGLHSFEAALSPQDLNLNKLLGIVKWEPVMSAQLQGMAQGLFPSFIRKTDQERAQNLKAEIFGYEDTMYPFDEKTVPSEVLHELERKGLVRAVEVDGEYPVFMKIQAAKARRDQRYEVTMKLDGSSMTTFARCQFDAPFTDADGDVQNPVEVGVCSRNLQLKVTEGNFDNSFVKMAMVSGLTVTLQTLATEHGIELAVQGELMGPGIQGNREQLNDFELHVFDIYNIRTGLYLLPAERMAMMNQLYDLGVTARVKHVPILFENMTLDELGLDTMEKLLAFAEGPSIKHPIREGLVYKAVDSEFSFKTISNKYLEKEKD